MSIISEFDDVVNPVDNKSAPYNRWYNHKMQSLKMASRLMSWQSLYIRGVRMRACGNILSETVCPVCGRRHINSRHYCHDRLCPLCQWRLSHVRYTQMLAVLDLLDESLTAKNISVAMLTLTLRNCPLPKLRHTLQQMSDAWKKMSARKFWRDTVVGAARHVEITYNSRANTYHPHLHIFILANNENINELGRLARAAWRAALGIDYDPITDIRQAYTRSGRAVVAAVTQRPVIDWSTNKMSAARSAARECAKYIVGAKAMAEIPDAHLPKFAAAIAGIRFVSYTGCIKTARAALKYDDEKIPADDETQHYVCRSCGAAVQHYLLEWSGTGYIRVAVPDYPASENRSDIPDYWDEYGVGDIPDD